MNETPRTLFVVRVRPEPFESAGGPAESEKPFGMEGIFASRERAEAFQAELECRAARSGDPGPLLAIRSLAQLRQLSAFEPCVLRDWLIDHNIPDPDTFVRPGPAQEYGNWSEWARAAARHWTFRGRGPKEQDVGRWLDWVSGEQQDDRYLSWLLTLSRQQRADLYAALHHFRFYEVVEVPFIVGDYPEEKWEGWEAEARTRPLPPCLTRAREVQPGPPGAGPADAEPPPSHPREDIPF